MHLITSFTEGRRLATSTQGRHNELIIVILSEKRDTLARHAWEDRLARPMAKTSPVGYDKMAVME
jgi:hypothetical protein